MKNLATKMIQVMQDCSHVMKNGQNSFYGYKYATSADVLEKVNAALVKNGICSLAVPEVLSSTDITTAKGTVEHLTTVKINITLIDIESGKSIGITGIGSGLDNGDKAVMKAQASAIKYAYMLSLAISTGDDPEADRQTDEKIVVIPAEEKSSTAEISKTKLKTFKVQSLSSTCRDCGIKITEKVMYYSKTRYGRPLCIDCQRKVKLVS